MNVLALDGALGPFSCCFTDGRRYVTAHSAGNDALEAGLSAVARVLRDAGAGPGMLDRIAVGIGPGSFTGLRIAVSYAKGLSLAWDVPLVGISSHDALEPDGLALPVMTVVSGRAGIICARLRTADGSRSRCGAVVEVLDELANAPHDDEIAVVGATEDVLSALGERGLNVKSVPPRTLRPAEALAQLATRFAPAVSPHAVRPDYGEMPAAKVPRFR